MKAAPAGQQAAVVGKVERAHHDAEFVLAAPDPAAKQGGAAQRGGARRGAKPRAVSLGHHQPGAEEALDPHGDVEEGREDGRQALGVPRLAGEVAGEVQLGQVRHRVAIAQAVHPQAHQGADIEREPIVLGAVEADRWAGIRPGAIEQRQGAVVEDVGEMLEAAVAIVARPVARIFGQVHGQWAVGTEQPEEMHQQPRGVAVVLGLPAGEGGGGEFDCGKLRQPNRVLRRADGAAETRAIPVQRLQPAHRLIEVPVPGCRGEVGVQIQDVVGWRGGGLRGGGWRGGGRRGCGLEGGRCVARHDGGRRGDGARGTARRGARRCVVWRCIWSDQVARVHSVRSVRACPRRMHLIITPEGSPPDWYRVHLSRSARAWAAKSGPTSASEAVGPRGGPTVRVLPRVGPSPASQALRDLSREERER